MQVCGIYRPCSPVRPVYSGKLIAWAVELYLYGVKPGYMRWRELQDNLHKEFPEEFPKVSDGLPYPEAVLEWVRKYPDAPQRLRDLRVQQASQNLSMPRISAYSYHYQTVPAVAATSTSVTGWHINAMFGYFMAMMTMAMMVRLAWSSSQS